MQDQLIESSAGEITPAQALKLIESLEAQVARTRNPHLRQVLLRSGCDLIQQIVSQCQNIPNGDQLDPARDRFDSIPT